MRTGIRVCISHGREAIVLQGGIVTFLSQHWTLVSKVAAWVAAEDLVTLNFKNFKNKHTLNNFAEAALHEFQENLH